jgi:autotransporter-associated beta strand protein
MKPSHRNSLLRNFLLAATICITFGESASAASVYWDTNANTGGSGAATGNWGSSNFWSTDVNGSTATTGTLPTANDDVFIAAGTNGTTGTITVTTTKVAGSITLQEPAANPGIIISSGTSLTLGGGSSASKGLFVTGNGTHTVSTPLILSGANTIQNAGTGTFTVSGGITGTGNLTLNNNSTSATGISISAQPVNNTGAISNTGTSTGTVVLGNANGSPGTGSAGLGANVTSFSQDSATSPFQFLNANNSAFTGAYNINAGTLQFSGTNTTGTITATNAASVINLGATSGTATATLAIGNNAVSGKINNNINVRAGSTGVKTMITVATSTSFATTGLVTLDDNLTLTPPGLTTFGFTFNNSIVDGSSGPKGITKSGAGSVYLAASNTYSGATSLTNGTLQLTGANGSLNNTAGISVSGGTFQLNNTAAANNGNRIPDSTVITMTGGTLDFKNDAGAATNFSETIAVTAAGAGTINANQAAVGQTSTLTIGTFARNTGSSLSFTGTGLGIDSRNVILFTTPPALTNGVIPWATSGSTTFAAYDPTNGVTPATTTDIDAQGSTITDAPTINLRILPDGTGAAIALGAATTTINTLVQANVGALVNPTIDTASKSFLTNSILVASGARPLTIGVAANDGTLTTATAGGELILINNSANSLNVNAAIADNTTSSTLAKFGSGNATFAGTNTYTGNTSLTGGIITAANASAFGSGAVTINPTTNRLVINDGLTLANNITFKGGGASSRGIFENSGAGEATLSGTITIDGPLAGGGHFGNNFGGTLKVTGAVNSTGPAVTSRLGTVIFSGGGSYTNFIINEGTVRLGATNGLSTTATVDAGATNTTVLDLAGFDQSLVGIIRSAGVASTIGNSSTTTNSTLTVTGTSTYPGGIANGVSGGTMLTSLQITNGASLTLTGTFTATTPTIASGGTLIIGAGGGDGINPSTKSLVVPSGALLRYTGANRVQNDTIINVNSGGVFDANGQADSIGYLNGAGSITNMNGTLTLTGPVVGSGSEFSGTITGTGTISFIANGAGASSASNLILSGANDIGGMSVAGGRVIARNTAAFGNPGKIISVGAGSPTLDPTIEFQTDTPLNSYSINVSGGNTGTIELNRATPGAALVQPFASLAPGNATLIFEKGANVTSGTPTAEINSIALSAGVAGLGSTTLIPIGVNISVLGDVTRPGPTASLLKLDGTSTGNVIAGVIQDNGANKLNITKQSTGTWTLGGTNTYTGTTVVNDGTLHVNGSLAAGSAVTVGGASATGTPTLTGADGTVNGTLNIAAAGGGVAGTVSPGTVGTTGTLNAGSTSIAGTYACDVSGISTDLLAVTGDLVLTGSTLTITGTADPGTYVIATYTGSRSGNLGGTLPAGYSVTYDDTNKEVELVIASASTPFDTWIKGVTGYFPGETNAAIVGKDADPDGDSINNITEFALDGNPTTGVSNGKVVGKIATVGGSPTLIISLPVRTGATFSGSTEQVSNLIDGVTYKIQSSDELTTWNLAVSEVLGTDKTDIESILPPVTSGWTRRTFQSPGIVSGDATEFLRAAIVETP